MKTMRFTIIPSQPTKSPVVFPSKQLNRTFSIFNQNCLQSIYFLRIVFTTAPEASTGNDSKLRPRNVSDISYLVEISISM